MSDKRYRIADIHQHARHPGHIYAHLVDVTTGEVVISATLDYITAAILERGYVLEDVRGEQR